MTLCSRDDVKDYLNLTTAEDDDTIKSLTEYMSAVIDKYCDRTIESTVTTEYHNGHGVRTLYPNQYPITSVSGIWQDTAYEWGSGTEIDSSKYLVVNSNNILLKSDRFYEYPMCIKIIYTAGYSTIPDDLKFVCITEVVRHLKRRDDPAVISRSSTDSSISYDIGDFLPTSKVVLDRYKKVRVF